MQLEAVLVYTYKMKLASSEGLISKMMKLNQYTLKFTKKTVNLSSLEFYTDPQICQNTCQKTMVQFVKKSYN